MGSDYRLSNRSADAKRSYYAKCTKTLNAYFSKWRVVFPTHEVSKEQMAVYLEVLSDLSLEELETGCREVLKRAMNFPKPAEIIQAAKAARNEQRYERPDYLDEPANAEKPEWREMIEATARSKALPQPARRQRSLEEQKQILREKGFLQ